MEINKIILRNGQGTLENQPALLVKSKDIIVYERAANEKRNVTVLFMPNTSGKTLIFNGLEHLFSFVKDGFVKETNKDLEIEIQFTLDGCQYVYTSNYYNTYKVTLNGEVVSDFENILRENIGANQGRLEYYGKDRNSLHSISRFFFLNFSGIKDDETSNEIPFINSRFDGASRKFILAYILGTDIDNVHFKTLTEIEHKKSFVDKHRKKFERYEQYLATAGEIGFDLSKLFCDLESERIMLGDISIAIKELGKLRDDCGKIFGTEDPDYIFLNSEIGKLEVKKNDIKNEVKRIRDSIEGNKLVEGKILLNNVNSLIKSEDQVRFEQYVNYKDFLTKINQMEIDSYLQTSIDPFIKKFKEFLANLYDIFSKKAEEKGLLTDLFPHGNIEFDENSLNIKAFFNTSEGIRKAIRVLTFVGLQIYSKIHNTKCLDHSFYDSFIENVDSKHREVLFDTVFEFAETNKYEIPNMFFFVTKIESNTENHSINDLTIKYHKYINLIENEGLKMSIV